VSPADKRVVPLLCSLRQPSPRHPVPIRLYMLLQLGFHHQIQILEYTGTAAGKGSIVFFAVERLGAVPIGAVLNLRTTTSQKCAVAPRGRISKAHRPSYHSTLGLGVIKKRKELIRDFAVERVGTQIASQVWNPDLALAICR